MLLHAPLLRLPYFWDEAGYYVPAARDLFLTGSLIPQSTPSNAHPPLVMAWLALAWRVFGYSPLVTRTAMLALSAFSLLGSVSACREQPPICRWRGRPPRWWRSIRCSSRRVLWRRSTCAAAGFTFWALAAYIEDRPWEPCSGSRWRLWRRRLRSWRRWRCLRWEVARLLFFGPAARKSLAANSSARWQTHAPPLYVLLPVVPLAGWFAYHYAKTGFLLGNPEFFRYNVAATAQSAAHPPGFRVAALAGLRILRSVSAYAGGVAGDAASAAEW